MKKFWIGVFAIAALLAGAAATGIVVAQDSNSEEDTAPKTILGRVAAILRLEEATVEDAFQQARKDQRTQAYREMLDRRVEKGRVTSKKAEEQFLWFQSRPDSLTGSFQRGGHQRPGFGHQWSFRERHSGVGMRRWNKRHSQGSNQ